MAGKTETMRSGFKIILPILFFSWSALLVYLSIMPGSSIPGPKSTTFRLDYIEHMAAFGLYAFLYVLWRRSFLQNKRELILFLITGIIYALFTELIQHFIPDRTVNPMDILFNLIGLFSGLFFTMFLFKTRKKASD